MAKGTDMYMNFRNISFDFDASDSSTLVEGNLDTGLSIRGKLAWLIHSVEIIWSEAATASLIQRICLSTRGGEASRPNLADAGTIFAAAHSYRYNTSGLGFDQRPQVLKWLPPIPLAAPKLSLYGQTDADQAALRGETVNARIGYTTVALDAAMYTEIAETWGW